MIYDISDKILIGPKALRTRFAKIDGFIRIYEETRCLTFLGSEKHDALYNRIIYLIILKISITCVFPHYYAKIKVDFYDSWPIEKHWLCIMLYNTH